MDLTQRISHLSPGKQRLLELRLKKLGVDISLQKYSKSLEKNGYTVVKPVEKKEYYELSSAQKRLYVLQQLEPGSTAYNITKIVSFREKLERNLLLQAFEKLIERHDGFRTSFELINDEPIYRVHRRQSVTFNPVYYHDVGNEKMIIMDFIKPFHPAAAPILRVGVLETAGDKQILIVDMHHIISDGTSDNILIGEFIALYAGEKLPALKLQYKDYSEWLKHRRQKKVLEQQEDHWLGIYSGEIPVLNLPTDYSRPAVWSFAGKLVRFEIDSNQTGELKKIALQESVTIYMLMSAVFYVLLAKLSGQEDIVVGTDVQNRGQAELQRIIGVFINTLALRNYPKRESPFNVFLEEVRNNTLKDFENQEYPFEELVERLGVRRDPGRNPLFDVMFALRTMPLSATVEGKAPKGTRGLTPIPYDFKDRKAKFDLLLVMIDMGDRLLFNFEYYTELFSAETMKNFIKHLREIVSAVINNTTVKIKDIVISHDLLTAQKTITPVEFGF